MKTFEDGYYIKEFNELNGMDEGKEQLLMEGLVMGIGEIEHYSEQVVLKCHHCKDDVTIRVDDFKDWRHFKTPDECPKCGGEYTLIQHDKGNIRRFLFGEDKASNPISITGFVFKDDVYGLRPGEKLKINALLHSVKNPKSETYKRVLDVKRMSTLASKPLLPTDEELKTFKEMDKEKLIDSFAPNIKGMRIIKEGLLISCLGGVNLNGQRGDVNVLLMGDPGVAKTQLLKFIATIIQKSDYTSGKSASQAGLMAGVDNLADGTRIAKPGSVIMCNGGICCIDEFEKMNASDRAGLHEVMENQTFSLRKIGINMTWEAKTTIFAAANPRSSKWDTTLSIKENVNLMDSLLSRFGLIFLIRDIPNKEFDLEVARHIRKVKQRTLETVLEPQMLTKFINYARTINPIISDEVAECIEQYWIDLRCESQSKDSILIDNRTLQDLYRLAESYARLDLSDTVTREHGNKAIKLLTESLKSLGMSVPGQMTESIMDHLDKPEYLAHLFKDGISEGSAIIDMVKHKQWYITEERAKRDIERLRKEGKIYDMGDKYKWV